MDLRAPSPILVALVGVALACVMDAFIKHVGASYSALTIAFARFGFGALAALVVYALVRPARIIPSALPIHGVRAVTIVIAATTFFYALSVLTLAEAVVLGFAAPLCVPFIARVLLKEKLRKASLAGAFVGFLGVVVAAWRDTGAPFSDARLLGYLAMAISAPTYALSLVLLRYRAAADGSATIAVMGNVLPALILAGPALALAPAPAGEDLWTFALIGALGASFWMAATWAYARAPAQVIAPLDYTALLWSSLLGYFAFGETPTLSVYLGAGFIVGACLLVTWDEKRARLQAETAV